MLNFLRNLKKIENIEVKIVNLPLGRKFSYVDNGKYRRRCVLAKIKRMDGYIVLLIEIERKERALSTLMLSSNEKQNWSKIYCEILRGLVNESGKWSNNVFLGIEKNNISVKRIRHTRKNRYESLKNHIFFRFQ